MDEKRDPVSIWTIAGGVLLALIILRGCDQLQMAMAQREAIEQFNATMAALNRPTRAAQRATAAPDTTVVGRLQQPRQERRPVPLAPDERCLDGRRFRRVANGWIQNGSC